METENQETENPPSCYFDVDFNIDDFVGYNHMLKDYCDVDVAEFVEIIQKTGVGNTIFLMGYSYSTGFYMGKVLKINAG